MFHAACVREFLLLDDHFDVGRALSDRWIGHIEADLIFGAGLSVF
jgi:hypothetical protein